MLSFLLLAQQREQRDPGLVVHLLRDLLLDELGVGYMINVEVVAKHAGKGCGRDEFFCAGWSSVPREPCLRVPLERTLNVPHKGISDLERVDVEINRDRNERAPPLCVLFQLIFRTARPDRFRAREVCQWTANQTFRKRETSLLTMRDVWSS